MIPPLTCDVCYKVMLVGDSGVGKTALLDRATSQYKSTIRPTIGIDYRTKMFTIDGATIKLQIWDTTGQERFQTVTRCFYRGAKGVVLVYDISNKESFQMLPYWLDCIEKELDSCAVEPVPILLVGNKCDMDETRQVSYKEGKKFATSRYMFGFLETSAKLGTNVSKVFSGIATAATEIYHPRLMNSYLAPYELEERTQDQFRNPKSSTSGRPLSISSSVPPSSATIVRKATARRHKDNKLVHVMMGCFTCGPLGSRDHKPTVFYDHDTS